MTPRERSELVAMLRRTFEDAADALNRLAEEPPTRPSDEAPSSPPAAKNGPPYLTSRATAVLLDVSEKWLQRHRKDLPFAIPMPGGRWKYSEAGAVKWMEQRAKNRP